MRKLILFILLIVSCNPIFAQNAIVSAGGTVNGVGGSVSFSIGQLTTVSANSSTGSISNGIQQPFEFTVLNSQEELLGDLITVSAFPNPTNENIILKLNSLTTPDFNLRIINESGKNIFQNSITTEETIISLKGLSTGLYFLIVSNASNDLKSFKIMKL